MPRRKLNAIDERTREIVDYGLMLFAVNNSENLRERAEKLRRLHENGYPFAANIAYLDCKEEAWHWLEPALRSKLFNELGRSKEFRRLVKTRTEEYVRYETFNWLRLRGIGEKDALQLAAALLGTSRGSVNTARNHVHKKLNLPEGAVPPAKGTEEMEPCDFPGWPENVDLDFEMVYAFEFTPRKSRCAMVRTKTDAQRNAARSTSSFPKRR